MSTNEDDVYPSSSLRNLFRRRPKLYSDGDPGTGFDYSKEGEEYQRRKALGLPVGGITHEEWKGGLKIRPRKGPMDIRMGDRMDDGVYRGPFPPPSPQNLPNYNPQHPPLMELLAQGGNRQADVNAGQGSPMAQQVAQQTRPRTLRDVLLQKTAQPTPQNPIPQAAAPADALPQQSAQPSSQQPPFAQSRPRIADPLTFDEQHLRELEGRKDPFWKRLAAASVRAAQAASHQDISPDLTSGEREITKLQNRLGRDVAITRARQQFEQGQMVPFQLPDGSWTQVPAKQVATIASRQQGQQATLSLRRQQMEAHNKRWDTMGKHEAAQDAQRLYNSGAADDNEDLRDEIASRMGLPQGTRLPPHTQGQIRVDEQGNYVLVNPRSGAVTPTQAGSYQKTTEAGRQRRFDIGQANTNQRAANVQAGLDRRAGMRAGGAPKVDAQTRKYALGLVDQINKANDAIANFDKNQRADIPLPAEAAATRAQLVDRAKRIVGRLQAANAGYEAGQDERGYPYAKQATQAAPQVQQGGVSESQIRDAAKAKGLDPDVAVQRARARGIL